MSHIQESNSMRSESAPACPHHLHHRICRIPFNVNSTGRQFNKGCRPVALLAPCRHPTCIPGLPARRALFNIQPLFPLDFILLPALDMKSSFTSLPHPRLLPFSYFSSELEETGAPTGWQDAANLSFHSIELPQSPYECT
jgi:hypothetical protein